MYAEPTERAVYTVDKSVYNSDNEINRVLDCADNDVDYTYNARKIFDTMFPNV